MPGKAKLGTLIGFAWSYAHLFLMMSIVALSAGVTRLISNAGEQTASPEKWLILLSLAASFIFMAIIGYVAEFGNETNNAINLKLVWTRFIFEALIIA